MKAEKRRAGRAIRKRMRTEKRIQDAFEKFSKEMQAFSAPLELVAWQMQVLFEAMNTRPKQHWERYR